MEYSRKINIGKNSVALWCESIIGFYSLKPLVHRFEKKSYQIYIYTNEDKVKILKDYLGNLVGIEVISIESINTVLSKLLNFTFRNFFTNPNFSVMYERNLKKNSITIFSKFIGRYLYLDNNNINNFYYKLFSKLRSKLKSNYLISISRVQNNHLICARVIKHVSIMESWDHPVKSPYWHKPKYLLTWNKSLRSDFCKYQNFINIKFQYIRPIKFRYISERKTNCINVLMERLSNNDYIRDIDIIKSSKTVVYATTTSSLNPQYHDGEMKLIKMLCESFRDKENLLYIKPKPNGPEGDYDEFKNNYSNVFVGTYSNNSNGTDMLNEEYHTFRYLILYHAKLLVNFGTTFVLEASLMNIPIFQLKLSEDEFGKFGNYSKNIHIKKYLLNEFSFKIRNVKDIVQILENKNIYFVKYSNNLKLWINEK